MTKVPFSKRHVRSDDGDGLFRRGRHGDLERRAALFSGTYVQNGLHGFRLKSIARVRRDRVPVTSGRVIQDLDLQRHALAGREAFANWRGVIARALLSDGFSKVEARRLATLTISAIEGSLILARVESSGEPIEDVAKSLAVILRKDVPSRRRAAG